MSDSFDEFQPVNNEWDEFAVAPGSGPSNKDVARAVVPANPDHAAAAAKLAKKYNASDEVLLRNLQDVQVQDAVNEYSKKLAAAPVLADYMRKSPFVAKQSHDDIDALTQVNSSIGALSAASLGQSVLGLSESLWRIPDAAQRLVGNAASAVEQTGLPPNLNPIRGVQDVLQFLSEGQLPIGPKLFEGTTDFANRVNSAQEILTKDTVTFGEAFADVQALGKNADTALKTAVSTGDLRQLGQVVFDPRYWTTTVAQAAPSLLASYLSGGSLAVIGLLEALEQANSVAEYEQRTGTEISDAQFTQAVAQTMLINGALEKAGLDKVLGAQGKGLSGILRAMAGEGGTEGLQQINSNLAAWLAYDENKDLLEGVLSSVMGGVGSGGSMATVSAAGDTMQRMVAQRQQQNANAQGDAQRLTAAMQAATASKLRERNPETFAQLVQHIAENTDGAPQSVYIDAQVLNQSGLDIAAVLPGVVGQMEAALATNGTVEVPISEALANLPGTPLEQIFLQNARSAPDALSLADAEQQGAQAAEFIKQEADRVLQQAQDQSAWQASTDAVRTTILDQLNQAGRFTPEVNEAYATLQMNFFSTMAARTGITPREMYDRFSLKVAAGAQAKASQVLNAGAKPGEITVEGYHFSKAPRTTLVGDAFGRGLMGTHRDQFMEAADQRLRKRIYFYADIGRGINPEDGVGGFGHKANLTNIYDVDADPLRLKTGRNYLALESAILDAGYDGYLSRESGHVIVLGDKAVQVDQLPTGGHKTGTTVVPPPERTEARGRDKAIEAVRGLQGLPIGQIDLERWSNMLARKAPEAHAEMAAAGVFDGPGDFYKDELVRRFIDRTEAPVYEQSLSSRLPSAVKATEDPLSSVLNITYDVVLADTKTLAKNVAALQGLPNVRKLKGKGAKDPVRNVEAFIDHVTNNLLWLHDHMPAEMRDRARLWYDGGRKTVETWAKRYGISEMQGAAAIAVLSPQNGWFANVSQAERIADMVFGLRDYVWDDAMTAEAERISPDGVLDDKMQAAVGKSLGELLTTPDIAARWARVYDQAHNNRAYRVLTPEGGAADYVKTGAGTDATMMWKSYSTIAKAISVLTDGRAENVHYQIGKEHKVRNFYNNIFDPDSALGYATIDTHAVAAALLRPLASADVEVAQAFGGAGSASSAVTGLNGTYPIYLEAYRRAAEARGIQPRQMQSITWEAVRGLFEATAKRGMKAPANAIWERYKAGEIEQAQAQQEILALAGDITPPAWTDVPFNDTVTRTYEGAPQVAVDSRPAVEGTESKVMFEVAPDPNDTALTEEWNALTSAERLEISQRVAARIVPEVLRELGTGGDFVLQLGGYLGATNPSMTLRLERPELALTAAKMLGHALSQDSMMVVAETPFVGSEPVGVVTLHLPEGYGETEVTALYDRLWQLKNEQGQELVGGHTTSDGQMVILNYSGLDDADLAARIDAHLGGEFDVDIDTVYSAFPSKEEYGYGDQRQEGAAPAGQSPAQRRPSDLRAAAAESLRAELDARRAAAGGAYTQAGQVNAGRSEQTGDRGAGRAEDRRFAPLEGAPAVPGFQGPDPRLVSVAEQYARDNGIELKRQAEFVEVDTERASRIAAAYEVMEHAPNDPVVREAYENLIRQTRAQYDTLAAAGYKFWFMDLSREDNQQYASSPWNAMRDIRANQSMGVFPTNDGFGSSEEFSPEANPLLADTGLQWPVGGPDGPLAPVLANDLFRAVHDAFGHGLEGAGFRARGEENAWQAHVRLFTGSAVGAITSETRGQNSWLNYGPYGEANRNAAVEDTVFAEQKNGLMPEWTWTEGRAGDMQDDGVLNQDGPLLAPNGKPSNLDRKLHAMVRTPEFKAWFGDWENDPTNASKAVDENGEPKVYYHGSENAGFTEFDVDGEGKTRGTGAFFADTFSMAKGYSGSRDDAPIYTPEQIFADPDVIDGLEIEEGVIVEVTVSSRGDKAWQWYANEEEALADLELEPGEDLGAKPGYRMTDPNGYETKGTKEEILAELEGMTTEAPGVYEVFLNVRDLVTIDWQGNNWDDGPKEKAWNILDENGDIYETVYSQEEADAALERNPGFTAEEDEQSQYDSTDDAARQGRDIGADGVLIKDVQDTGPKGYAEDGDVLIVYKPENIKEVRNQGTFDPANPNILKQGPRGTFNPQTLLISLNENANLSTFLHESGHFFLEVMADLAAQPNAPAEVREDMDKLLAWFGVPDIATWNSYTLDQKRPHHERFAESFEAYLLEGKAPSAELQPLFRKFRSWLVNVYMSLSEFMRGRNLDISPEIRQVFDRMLATDEQIRQAEDTAGMLPDFDATNEAIEKLQARSLRDLKWTIGARSKALKALQKEAANLRKAVEAEVRAEVEATPEMRAKAALDDLRKTNKRAPTDMETATVADAFGYPTVDAMLQAIDAYGPKEVAIEGMTDQRMLENFGELATPEAIEEAANDAVHNEARARSLATELKGQADALNPREDTGRTASNGRPITVNALVAAAKEFAENLVARRKVKDLKNAAWQHRAAEARAGKAWQEATAKGKTQEAVQAKRDQMLNNYAAKAMGEAQAEIKKILDFFARVTKGNDEKTVTRGRDPDVVNAARAILAAYDITPRLEKGALEYLAVLKTNDPTMYAALEPSIAGAMNNAKPVGEMTMEELRGLRDEIDAMWHLAKRSRQMEVDGNLLDIQDAADELQTRMQETGVPDTMPGDARAITNAEQRGRWLQHAGSLLRRAEQWAEGMDGKFGGPFLRLVFQPVKEAANRYRADRVKYRKAYQALVDTVAPALGKGPIAAPEIGYTFGEGHNGIGHAELLHAILHTGNESNKRKLLLGREDTVNGGKWATENADGTLDTTKWDAFIQRMQDTGVLGKEHYDFAQGVWDLLEQTKPLAQKTHRDVFGRYFDEVAANSFDTPFGTYRGGYVPAQADPRIVQDADLRKLAEAENENMAYSFPATNKGFTKGRVEYNRPLLLDLRTIGQHIDKVLLFAHMEPAVRDVNKLLSQKGVSYSLGRIDPTIYAGMLTPWLSRSARQIVETPILGDGGISRVLSAARSRAGMALMFANVSNSIQQLSGFANAFSKLKSDGLKSQMLRATAQFISSPKEMSRNVASASTFMNGRMENEIAAINDAMDAILLDPSLFERTQAWTQKHAYFLQTAFANTMEPIIWTAGYNAALEKGMDERDAVRYADGLIRQTQGSTLPEDVSRIETGPAYGRIFTQFIGYFNMMANTNATGLKQISQDVGLKKGAGKALLVVTTGMLVPLWVAEAIAQAMRGGPDDEDDDGYLDDWLAAVFGMGTIKGTFAMVPFVGQIANVALNKMNGNPADDRASLSPAVSLLEAGAGVPKLVYQAITDPEKINARNAVRDVASALSIATGAPVYALARPLGYLAGVADDKIEPTGPADAVRGAVTGTPSAESRTR